MINKKLLFPLVAIPYAYATCAYGGEYIVKEGESISSILQYYRQTSGMSTKGEDFKRIVKKVLDLNPTILNANLIKVGQKLQLPKDYSFETTPIQKYEVKFGDTFSEIAQRFLEHGKIWSKVNYLKKYNPKVKNIDFIRSGSIINIPSSKKRREIATNNNFSSNPELTNEIYFLKSTDAQDYILAFRSLVQSESKIDLVKSLKFSLELSRKFKNDHLEQAFLELITVTLKSKDDIHLDEIKKFLLSWKRVRKKKKQNGYVSSL